MKLATWNVNSLRMRLARVLSWLAAEKPDVLCIQETKVTDDRFPVLSFTEIGYHAAVHGQKTYNGVAILARTPPEGVAKGLGFPDLDDQARCLRGTVGGIRVVNVYVPNGSEVGSDKFEFKLRWMAHLREMLERDFRRDEDLVVCGDMNVAPEEIDVHDPGRWRGQVLFSDEERAALAQVRAFGLKDALRLVTREGGIYTWWDYRQGAFHRGWGLRIDHVLVTEPLAGKVTEVRVDREARKGKDPSDHAPVVAVW